MKKKSKGQIAVEFSVLSIIALFFVLPLAWLISSSLSPSGSLYQYSQTSKTGSIFPAKFTFENFIRIFTEFQFWKPLLNSLLVSSAAVVIGVTLSSMAGFSLAKFEFRGKKIIFFLVIISFMVPFEAIAIPLLSVTRKLGIYNTYLALILPGAASGMAIFLFRQFFLEIPSYYIEAARLEGASWLRIYLKILIPMSKHTIAAVTVMIFMFQWNSLFWPLIATHSQNLEVVQVAIASNIMSEETVWADLFSSSVAGSIPPVVLFIFLQKYFVRNLNKSV